MKKLLVLVLLVCTKLQAQELFVVTEPASNMPSKSLGVRITNNLMKAGNTYNYFLLPEIMWGANKNLMIHADAFASNRTGMFKTDGGGVYAKYRFYSKDDVHNHFRLAAYSRASYNNSIIYDEDIETAGKNSGYEVGLIATKLLHKTALSSTIGYEKALDNNTYKFPAVWEDKAFNYTLSVGQLVLPKEYINYNQTNLNVMVELLGQTLVGSGKSYLDVAPSVQLIFNSQARVDLGYRKQLYSNIQRSMTQGFLLRFEYLLFNFFK